MVFLVGQREEGVKPRFQAGGKLYGALFKLSQSVKPDLPSFCTRERTWKPLNGLSWKFILGWKLWESIDIILLQRLSLRPFQFLLFFLPLSSGPSFYLLLSLLCQKGHETQMIWISRREDAVSLALPCFLLHLVLSSWFTTLKRNLAIQHALEQWYLVMLVWSQDHLSPNNKLALVKGLFLTILLAEGHCLLCKKILWMYSPVAAKEVVACRKLLQTLHISGSYKYSLPMQQAVLTETFLSISARIPQTSQQRVSLPFRFQL